MSIPINIEGLSNEDADALMSCYNTLSNRYKVDKLTDEDSVNKIEASVAFNASSNNNFESIKNIFQVNTGKGPFYLVQVRFDQRFIPRRRADLTSGSIELIVLGFARINPVFGNIHIEPKLRSEESALERMMQKVFDKTHYQLEAQMEGSYCIDATDPSGSDLFFNDSMINVLRSCPGLNIQITHDKAVVAFDIRACDLTNSLADVFTNMQGTGLINLADW